jgi:hypothetical protein
MASNFTNYSSYYGGGCGCGTSNTDSFSNATENFEDYNYYEDFEQEPTPSSQTLDPVSNLFSKFFESPLQSNSSTQETTFSFTPVVSTIAQKLQLDPQYLQSMISQVSAQFGIHPAELRENIAHFFSRYNINPNAVRSTITEIANQVGLKNKLGLVGPISPEAVKKALSSVDVSTIDLSKLKEKAKEVNSQLIGEKIAQINPNTLHKVGEKISAVSDSSVASKFLSQHQINTNKVKNVGEKLQGVSQSNLEKLGQLAQNKIQQKINAKKLAPATTIEVPQILNKLTGESEPVVLKNGKLINGVSGVPVIINPANGQLVNPVDGQPAQVNGSAVVVNSQGQLVNATTGNSVTVPVVNTINKSQHPQSVINTFENANSYTEEVKNEYNPNASNVSWSNLGLSNNNQKRIKNYITSKYPDVDVTQITPTNVQRQIDDFLAQYTQE